MAPETWAMFWPLLAVGGIIGVAVLILYVAFEVEQMIRRYQRR